MRRLLPLLFCFLVALGGCYYTLRSGEGTKISAAQVQEIKLGKSTEIDLLKLLGPPTKREEKPEGSVVLLYVHTQWQSPTLPGGFVMDGFFDKEEEEFFEVILKSGAVQSYHFLKP